MFAPIRQFGFWAASLALAVLAVSAGCSQQGQGFFRSNDTIPDIEEFSIHATRAGKYCGAKTPLRLVVRDQAHMAFVPVSDVPVDFDREMVLFVTLGQVYAESYAISIDRVWRQGQTVKVGVTVTHPSPGEMSVPQPCSPYYLAVVPKSALNVEGFVAEVAPPTLEGSKPLLTPNTQGRGQR